MVAITVKEEDDAYRIFETLNDRGLRLSVPDLLLNLLMRRSSNANQRNQVRQKWNDMLQQMGRRDIARFIRHMWLSKYGDLKARGLFVEIKSHIETNKFDSLDFAQTCADECDSYISLIDFNGIPNGAVRDVTGLVKYLEIQSSLPLLLSARRCLSDSDFAKLAKAAVSLAVRYSLIANLNPADMESAFYEAAREIRGKKASGKSSKQSLAAAVALLKTIDPDDSIVETKAKELEVTRRQGLWLLSTLANSKQSKTKEISLDQANLEHIFPQKPSLKEWPNKSDLEPFLWHIGNLTALGVKLNDQSANKAFVTKRDSYYKKSEIKLTQGLLKYSAWTQTEINAWAGELAQLIINLWPKS